MKISIMGPQASGKGTQAEIIAEKYGLVHISPGAIFRQIVEEKEALGKEIESYIDAGKLVPHKLIMKIITPRLTENESFVLDGFPREKPQADALDKLLKLDAVILLEVPDKISKQRIQGRRECDNGHDYHIKYKPPKKEGMCDQDGLPLHMRDDDKDEVLDERLKIYHTKTEQVIKHYEKQGIVIKVNGDQSIDEVSEEIVSKLNAFIKKSS